MKKCCSECKQTKIIVNKKYCLCEECNFKRLHKGVSKYDHLKVKQDEYVKRMQQKAIKKMLSAPPPVCKSIKQQTSKESSVKSKLSVLKKQIELEAVQNNEYYCQGCGESYPGLDKSHILSVGMYKHLELVKENIQLMCRDCHIIWESGEIWEKMKLLCFNNNLLIIKKYDDEAYRKLLTKKEEEENNYFLKNN